MNACTARVMMKSAKLEWVLGNIKEVCESVECFIQTYMLVHCMKFVWKESVKTLPLEFLGILRIPPT